MKCECCGLREASLKDYRHIKDRTMKVFSCDLCSQIDDEAWTDVYTAPDEEAKKAVLRGIVDEMFWDEFDLDYAEDPYDISFVELKAVRNDGSIFRVNVSEVEQIKELEKYLW